MLIISTNKRVTIRSPKTPAPNSGSHNTNMSSILERYCSKSLMNPLDGRLEETKNARVKLIMQTRLSVTKERKDAVFDD